MNNKMIVLLLIALPVIFGAGTYWGMVLTPQHLAQQPKTETVQTQTLLTQAFKKIITNYKSADRTHTAMIQASISTRSAETLQLLAELMPVIRDQVLLKFKGKPASYFESKKGAQMIKEDIFLIAQDVIKAGGGDELTIESVLISELITQ